MLESKLVKGKFLKFAPHKTLNQGWLYFKMQGVDKIISMRINIGKTFLVVEKGGQPVINPQTKQPNIEFHSTNEIKILTIEEYEAIKQSGWDE